MATRSRSPVDFESLKRALLDSSERLVARWLPGGKKQGHEWQCGNLAGEPGTSCSVNLVTGAWADFATGEKGGDLIALYAAIEGLKMADAARRLIAEHRLESPVVCTPKADVIKTRTEWVPIIPVPDTAGPPPVAHIKRGPPESTWNYRDGDGRLLGQVHRFRTSDGGKEILPVVWARNAAGREEWRWQQWAVPRPLYGLDRLRDDRPVLIVEGEKCADAAHEVLGEKLDVVSWPGGGNAVRKVDWAPLAGRKVVLWPDCDAQTRKGSDELLPEAQQPGTKAAEAIAQQLMELGCEVRIMRIPAPGERPGGWDVADAIAEGANLANLMDMLRQLRHPAGARAAVVAPTAVIATSAGASEDPDDQWHIALLRRRGELVPCLANVVRILTCDRSWTGIVGYDEFASRTVRLAPLPRAHGGLVHPEAGVEWSDVDTSYTVVWLTNVYHITPAGNVVDEAIELIARANSFHPVRSYLRGLVWDGKPRIDTWLACFLGVPETEYSRRVARWYLVAMIARVMLPGVKFDYCLVLEGAQGLRKSAALRVLAGDWFSDTELDLTNKDAMSAIRGKWLHEFAEMGSIARVESMRQKSFLSRQFDEFRPPYGHREIRCARQLVFGGSTNEWQWNKDPTGGRRFWPVEVVDSIDTDGLADARDQLFAEALQAFEAGERYWPNSDEQRQFFDPEQLSREAEDAFLDPVHDWIDELPRAEFTLAEVLAEGLKLDAGRMTRDVMTRVGIVLKKLGCTRHERRNGVNRFVYRAPAWSRYQQAQQSKPQPVGDRDGQPMPF